MRGRHLPPPLSCTSEGCQVVEWVDIFANPVFKNPGMSIILICVWNVTVHFPSYNVWPSLSIEHRCSVKMQ